MIASSLVICIVRYWERVKLWFCCSVYSYLTVTSSQLLEHECNNLQGLRERERENIVRRKQNSRRRDLREKGSRLVHGVSQKISSCIRGCSGTVFTLSRYNINTVPMDVASPLEVNHVYPCVVRLFHVIVLYLFAICYLLHELCYQLMNVCMLSFSL